MNISSKILSAAMLCQAKNDIRFYLCGLHITPKYVEATNGHLLIRMEHGIKTKVNKIININGSIPAKAQDSKFTFGANYSYVRHFDSLGRGVGINTVDIVSGKFPDTDRVIKSDCTSKGVAAIHKEYLALPHKMFKGKFTSVMQEFNGKENKIKMTFDGSCVNEEYGNPVLYIMPVRV